MTTRYEVRDGVAILTLDNPPVNGLSYALRVAFAEALDKANADAAVKAVIVTGAGKAFSGGADIKEFGTPKALAEPNLLSVILAVENCRKPVVAAIHGSALGGGLEIAMACHWRVAEPDAKLGLPEVKLGLMPGARGTQHLPRLVGVKNALEIIAFGNPVTARAAHEMGLVDVIAEGDLLQSAIAQANKVVGRPPRRTALSSPTRPASRWTRTPA